MIKILPAILFLFVIIAIGFLGSTPYSSRAPDRLASIKVHEHCFFPDCILEIELSTLTRSIDLGSRSDCYLEFAHAAWREDQVAIYVDGGSCSPFLLGYDLAQENRLSCKDVAPWLMESLRESYPGVPVVVPEFSCKGGAYGLDHRNPAFEYLRREFYERFRN